MSRSIANRVYDAARRRAQEDMIIAYPDLWRFVFEKRLAEYRTPGNPIFERFAGDNTKTYDKARSDAFGDLRELRPGGYQALMWAWSQHFKDEYGYEDARAAENAARRPAVRGDDGRFAKTA